MTTRFSKKRVDPASVFAPWVTPDQRSLVANSNVYTAVLKICSKASIKCIEVIELGNGDFNVRLGTSSGLRVGSLSAQRSKGYLSAISVSSPDGRVFPSCIGTSNKPSYVANRMLNSILFQGALSAALKFENRLACSMFLHARHAAITLHPTEGTDIRKLADRNFIEWLLRLYSRDVTAADIPSDVRDKADKEIKHMATRYANYTKCKDLLREMFCKDKWVIGHNPSVGYWVGMFNMSKAFDKYMGFEYDHSPNDPGDVVDVVRPLQFYPSFESIPESIRKEIAPSQAMLNMYLDGSAQSVRFTGPERLVPVSRSTLFDAGAVSYTFNADTAAWWLAMDTV